MNSLPLVVIVALALGSITILGLVLGILIIAARIIREIRA